MGLVTDCLQLSGQNRKTLTERITLLVLDAPECWEELLACLAHPDIAIQKLAADLVKKIGMERPERVQPHKTQLLETFLGAAVPQVQWHLCHLLPSLEIAPAEFDKLQPTLLELYVTSPRRAAKADALTALVELSQRLGSHQVEIQSLLREALNSRIPAVAARARLLIGRVMSKTRPTWWK